MQLWPARRYTQAAALLMLAAVLCALGARGGAVQPIRGRGVRPSIATLLNRWQIHRTAARAARFENPQQGLQVTVTGRVTRLQLTHRAMLRLQLEAYRVNGRAQPLAAGTFRSHGARLDLNYGTALSAWYVNGAAGVEQGFTLQRKIGADRSSRLIFNLGGNLRARRSGDGLQFVDAAGRPVLRYAGLSAWDADRRRLPARMRLHGHQLELLVTTRGARFPVTVDPVFTNLVSEDEPSPGANHRFGYALALSDDGQTALVGAPSAVGGAAYVFGFNDNQWVKLRPLTDPENTAGDDFGQAVALSSDGSTALVGAPGTADGGKAYMYSSASGAWSGTPDPVPDDSPDQTFDDPDYTSGTDDAFGSSVALSADGGTALIGAPGTSISYAPSGTTYTSTAAGKVYVYSSGNWNAPAYTLSDPVALNATSDGVADDFHFGGAVALSDDGTTALVGAPGTTNGGAAYVYSASSRAWNAAPTQQSLGDPGATAGDGFGSSVALSAGGGTALIGAPGTSVSNAPSGTTYVSANAGIAYLYAKTNNNWPSGASQTFSDPLAAGAASDGVGDGDAFGRALALDGAADAAFIGAPGTSLVAAGAGAAYLWTDSSGTWTLAAAPTDPAAAASDAFGTAVALSADGLMGLVGAPNTATTGGYLAAGVAYRYSTTVDLGVTLSPAPTTFETPGTTLDYPFTVNNNDSSATATDVKFTDTVSGSGIAVKTTTKACSVSVDGTTVTCSFSSLGPGDSHKEKIDVQVATTEATVVRSEASVSGDQQDLDPVNNSVINSVTVDKPPAVADGSLTAYVTGKGVLSTGVKLGYSGQKLTYSIVTPPDDGTVKITDAATGAYTYTVRSGEGEVSGGTLDSFMFQASDGLLTSNTGKITVTAYGPPEAKSSTCAQPIDVTGSVTLVPPALTCVVSPAPPAVTLVTDPDPGATFTYSIVSEPVNGTLPGANGIYTYTSNSTSIGQVPGGQPDSFSFKVTDNHGNSSNVAVYTLQVYGPPTVPATGSLVVHNLSGSGILTAMVPDPQLIPAYSVCGAANLQCTTATTGCTGPSHGTVTIGTANSGTRSADFTYMPTDSSYTGSDCFTYAATVAPASVSWRPAAPATLVSNQGVVNITIYAPPVAQGTSIAAHVSTGGQLKATESDPAQTLSYQIVMPPQHGILHLNSATGAYTYTLKSGEGTVSGGTADSFVYDVKDQYSTSLPATVNITAYAAPTAGAGTLIAHVNAGGQLQASDPDITQALTYSLVTQPSHGSVTLNAKTGAYAYHASPGYDGSDSFSFKVRDAFNASNTAEVTLTVYSAPVAGGGTLATSENLAASGQLTASDPDSAQKLTYYLVVPPGHGSVKLDSATGAYTYTPDRGYSGSDVFTFAAKDAFNHSNTAVINVNVKQTESFGNPGNSIGPPPPAPSGGGAFSWLLLPLLGGLIGWRRRGRRGARSGTA